MVTTVNLDFNVALLSTFMPHPCYGPLYLQDGNGIFDWIMSDIFAFNDILMTYLQQCQGQRRDYPTRYLTRCIPFFYEARLFLLLSQPAMTGSSFFWRSRRPGLEEAWKHTMAEV